MVRDRTKGKRYKKGKGEKKGKDKGKRLWKRERVKGNKREKTDKGEGQGEKTEWKIQEKNLKEKDGKRWTRQKRERKERGK